GPELLPEFAPPRRVGPEELIAGMWTEEKTPGARAADADAMWAARERAEAPESAARYPARDRVAESTVEALAARFPRVVLLTSAQEAVLGWTGRGAGVTRCRIGRVR